MRDDHFEVLQQLEQHHALFGQFWSVGNIEESERIPTACVTFDKEGGALMFYVNPKFWNSLSTYAKAFVIGHECLHIYYDHGRRGLKLENKKMANWAMDVVVNHTLCDAFGFVREDIPEAENWIWRDTAFPDNPTIQANRAMEYYYNLLKDRKDDGEGGKGEGAPGEKGEGGGSGEPQTVDQHEDMFQGDADDLQDIIDAMKDALEDATDKLSNDEIDDFDEKAGANGDEKAAATQQAGTMAGELSKLIRLGKIIKKRTWEAVVKDILGSYLGKEEDIEVEQWAHDNRRMTGFGRNVMLPSDYTESIRIRDRVNVWFFMDTSGSCVEWATRFFTAAASIPDDKFKSRMFCFDTRVYETTLESGKLYGFGGTAFQPIEDAIQATMKKEECKYPDVVFLVTDGAGSHVSPQFADRWHWFITEDRWATERYIPKDSHTWKLKDFE